MAEEVTKKAATPLRILLVEDNTADAHLLRLLLAECGRVVDMHHAKDGVEALVLLRPDGPDAYQPDLVLLDLSLPKMNGLEVLRAVRALPHRAALPVVVLTTSNRGEDLLKSYELHASSFVTKPTDIEQFAQQLQRILDTVVPARPEA